LGVVSADDNRSYVVADIPGLIEGAHLGHGLGTHFLRHIERTRMLAHLVDVSQSSGPRSGARFEIIMEELRSFSEDLAAKPMIVVATKIDAAQDPERIASLRRLARRLKLPFLKISSVSGEGLPALKRALAEAVLAPMADSKSSPTKSDPQKSSPNKSN